MKHDTSRPLTFQTKDANGNTPDLELFGTRWQHTGNLKTYMVSGFSWDGERDIWQVIMQSPDGVPVTRPLDHIYGERETGVVRYVRVFE